jgi:hypothetical protein
MDSGAEGKMAFCEARCRKGLLKRDGDCKPS